MLKKSSKLKTEYFSSDYLTSESLVSLGIGCYASDTTNFYFLSHNTLEEPNIRFNQRYISLQKHNKFNSVDYYVLCESIVLCLSRLLLKK